MKKIICLILLCTLTISSLFAQEIKEENNIEVNGGIGLDDCVKYTFGLSYIMGIKSNEIFTIGVGLGYSFINGLYYSSYGPGYTYDYDSYDFRNNLSTFIRAKLNLTKTDISPFIQTDLGYTFGITGSRVEMAQGFLFEPAFGCDFKVNEKQSVYFLLGLKGMSYHYENFDFYDVIQTSEDKFAYVFSFHLGFKF